ncbi:MAG: rhodanese-like domain-containing protein [Clostridium sp.]|jgi:rhodanese-related sulfurtransferase|uniref:rhodanese-like domain-containing protein n=1 Tax=Clostridium sp. TaxID=1506 RepID=UPI0025C24F48|nr:rhodanese-like domain-containing protein [Clostridium sp.]MCH3963662.1 rhodanese-like domain-containing protein [Clostridium sp.]MCI1714803.1 rhodanese-like domain-containing protein [Clostridium sp.]MCI1799008.1 rhodanese-like domain-containing protein [Clostridium sp.]MCI1812986.1 rhodanese-like domain-containing protein [Clostridium sp.]MCI1869876.1 rhodanese-like domain-containing protein [Clostridium sp.]
MDGSSFKEISGHRLKKLLDRKYNFLLIDVRTPEEYSEGHIPGSKNIPLQEFENIIKKMDINFNTDIVVYCRSGIRASNACDILNKLGFKSIYNFGGIYNWKYELKK